MLITFAFDICILNILILKLSVWCICILFFKYERDMVSHFLSWPGCVH